MSETASATWPGLSEDDLLAYSHVQSLSVIQDQIQSLRTAIPTLLSPLLRAPSISPSLPTPGAKSEPEEGSVEFRKQATKVQSQVKSLVSNLEKICETLEAAEKVRIGDYNEKGELVSADPVQRTNIVKEEAGGADGATQSAGAAVDGTATLLTSGAADGLAPPIDSAEYLFSGTPGMTNGTGDLMHGDIDMDVFGGNGYNDFGALEAYGTDWGDLNFTGELGQQS